MLNADDKDIQTDFIHPITFFSKVKLNIIIVYKKKIHIYIKKYRNFIFGVLIISGKCMNIVTLSIYF